MRSPDVWVIVVRVIVGSAIVGRDIVGSDRTPVSGLTGELPARKIKRRGLALSVLGFGGASIGNLYRATSDEDAAAAVVVSVVSGMRNRAQVLDTLSRLRVAVPVELWRRLS